MLFLGLFHFIVFVVNMFVFRLFLTKIGLCYNIISKNCAVGGEWNVITIGFFWLPFNKQDTV